MLKAVLFDLDGTLVYQKHEYVSRVVQETLSRLGLPYLEGFTKEFWYGLAGDRNSSISKWLGIEDTKRFWSVFWELDDPGMRAQNTEAYEDVGVLEALREKGLKLGLVTSSLEEIAKLEMQKLNGFSFDCTVSHIKGAGQRLKPHPDPILAALKQLGVRASEAMYVGDSPIDIEASLAAGVKPAVVVREGNNFQSGGSHVVVLSSLYGLLQLV
jgi:pyrophosphatase PpaX